MDSGEAMMSLWLALCSGQALAEAPSARVVVLQWPETNTDYQSGALHKQLQSRVGPEAAFVPELDLYQPGRTEPDEAVAPAEQRGSPSSEILDEVRARVAETGAQAFDSMSEQEWVQRAAELRQLADELWFVDRLELREPAFLLYTQIGRAAENGNQGTPPYYEFIDGKAVNYYWYLAATLAQRDSSLLSKLLDQELHHNVLALKERLDAGDFKSLTLSFDLDERFDPRAFAAEYTLYVDGFEEKLTDAQGLLELPLGIHDVWLQRKEGGYGLSARFERQSVEKGFEYPMQTASKRVGLDLIEQLMEKPAECFPEVARDIEKYLGIYAALHPTSEIYVSVPQFGSTSSKKLWLWRWDRGEGRLELAPRKGCEAQ
jgi:hypothetical protein